MLFQGVYATDCAPSHRVYRAKATQDFLRNVVLDFNSVEEWALHSARFNPLGYLV